jgi:hypothetical protein
MYVYIVEANFPSFVIFFVCIDPALQVLKEIDCHPIDSQGLTIGAWSGELFFYAF